MTEEEKAEPLAPRKAWGDIPFKPRILPLEMTASAMEGSVLRVTPNLLNHVWFPVMGRYNFTQPRDHPSSFLFITDSRVSKPYDLVLPSDNLFSQVFY